MDVYVEFIGFRPDLSTTLWYNTNGTIEDVHISVAKVCQGPLSDKYLFCIAEIYTDMCSNIWIPEYVIVCNPMLAYVGMS